MAAGVKEYSTSFRRIVEKNACLHYKQYVIFFYNMQLSQHTPSDVKATWTPAQVH